MQSVPDKRKHSAGAPRFAESRPKLEIAKLLRQGIDWASFNCQTDGGAEVLVEGSISPVEDNVLLISWTDASGREQADRQPTRTQTSGNAPARTWFVCVGCKCICGVIYLIKDNWRCRKCHGLKYLSQYTTPYDKMITEFSTLEQELRAGRRPYQRMSKWSQKAARYQQLKATLLEAPHAPTHNEIALRRVETRYGD